MVRYLSLRIRFRKKDLEKGEKESGVLVEHIFNLLFIYYLHNQTPFNIQHRRTYNNHNTHTHSHSSERSSSYPKVYFKPASPIVGK